MSEHHENLPAVPEDAELADVAAGELDELPPLGEIVEDEPQQPRPVIVQVFQSITIVVTHPAPRAVARHAAYVPAGAVTAWRQWRRRRSLAETMAEQANAAGDRTAALALLQHAELERKGRHDRRMQRSDQRLKWLKAVPLAAAVLVISMAVLNVLLFTATHRARDLAWSFLFAADAVRFGIEAAAVLLWVLAYGGMAAVITAFYLLGRRGGDLAPGWAHTAGDDDADPVIDERAVTQALGQLKLKEITDYVKGGTPLAYIVPCRQEGRGTYCEVRLPGGLPAIEITKQVRRERLAAGLHRKTKEVYPSTGADNSVLKMWIADKGALDEGAGPYPLLEGGLTDVFRGLPFGRTLKGDPVTVPVIGRNSIIGGAPEQGKSNGARVIGAGYLLDVTTEMRIYVPDANFDFERYAPRCSSYVMGAEDEHVERIAGELEELLEELQKRGRILVDCEAEEVTRELAHAGIGLHPLWVLLEEAHVVIQHRKWGKTFQRLLPDIVRLDRKRGVHVTVSTQAPTKDSMPRDVTRNCTVGIAYAVGDHVANDALLGQGAYRGGHRATELIPGVDRGTALCKGFGAEARSEVVQAHRVSGRAGDDQVSPLVERAMAELARQGRAVPGTERGPLAIVSRDLLDDLAAVIRSPERILVRDAVGLLRELAPSWGRYREMTATSLRGDLLALGVRTVNTSGTHYLDPADLRRAIEVREACE